MKKLARSEEEALFFDLPSLVERRGHQVGEGGGLHVSALLQRVQVHLELHPRVERLCVRGQAGDTHEAALIDLEDSLEVAIDGHQLSGQTRVSGNRDAVLALHRDHRVPVVLILQSSIKRSGLGISLSISRQAIRCSK